MSLCVLDSGAPDATEVTGMRHSAYRLRLWLCLSVPYLPGTQHNA